MTHRVSDEDARFAAELADGDDLEHDLALDLLDARAEVARLEQDLEAARADQSRVAAEAMAKIDALKGEVARLTEELAEMNKCRHAALDSERRVIEDYDGVAAERDRLRDRCAVLEDVAVCASAWVACLEDATDTEAAGFALCRAVDEYRRENNRAALARPEEEPVSERYCRTPEEQAHYDEELAKARAEVAAAKTPLCTEADVIDSERFPDDSEEGKP